MPKTNPYTTQCASAMTADVLPVEFYENARRNFMSRNRHNFMTYNLADSYDILDILNYIPCSYCRRDNNYSNLHCEYCGAQLEHS